MHKHTASDSRIFVFGSNVLGIHGGGAAAYAARDLDAVSGVGEGPTGRSYALPTCSAPGTPLELGEVRAAVERFLAHARSTPDITYFVSEVGCGIAGFSATDIAPMFADAPANCDLPPGWSRNSASTEQQLPAATAPAPTTVMVLRVCAPDMTSYHGSFKWPESGAVAAPDWSPSVMCGYGLHGWLWGEGDPNVASHTADPNAKWLVVEVELAAIVNLQGKVKFPRGNVVYCGDRTTAVELVRSHAPRDVSSLWATLTGGARSTLTGGARSTLTGGYGSTLTGGARSTLTGGYGSTLTGGDGSTLVATWWCPKREKYRLLVVEVGEDGIEPETAYTVEVDAKGARFVQRP